MIAKIKTSRRNPGEERPAKIANGWASVISNGRHRCMMRFKLLIRKGTESCTVLYVTRLLEGGLWYRARGEFLL